VDVGAGVSGVFGGGEGGGEEGGEGGDRAVHETGEAGLDDLKDEEAAAGFVFFFAGIGGEVLLFEMLGEGAVGAFFLGQIIEEGSDGGVGGPAGGGAVGVAVGNGSGAPVPALRSTF
jgi:hypothetical protein